MAKITNPLFSLGGSGSVGKDITFMKRKGQDLGLKYNKPGDIRKVDSSPKQKDQRSIIGLITACWQCKTDIDKLVWETEAKAVRFKGSGYHYFLHLAKTDLKTYLGLVGYWSFNYNVGDKIPDLSGNNNQGTLSPNYPSNCPALVDSFNKKFGKAGKYDGNDYVNCGNNLSLSFDNTESFTLEAWFKIENGVTQEAPYTNVAGKDVGGPINGGYSLKFYNSNTKISVVCGVEPNIRKAQYTTDINDGIWHHVVMVQTPALLKLYIDGIFRASSAAAVGDFSHSGDFTVGCRYFIPDNFFKGEVDEVRIWNRNLSQEEIERHF